MFENVFHENHYNYAKLKGIHHHEPPKNHRQAREKEKGAREKKTSTSFVFKLWTQKKKQDETR